MLTPSARFMTPPACDLGAALVLLCALPLTALAVEPPPGYFQGPVPPPTTLTPPVDDVPPQVSASAGYVFLQNRHLALQFSLRSGLVLCSMVNHHTRRECLAAETSSRVFSVLAERPDAGWVGSDQFEVAGWELLPSATGYRLQVGLRHDVLGLDARLTVEVDEEPETTWGLELHNHGPQTRRICVAFPLLEGLRPGQRLENSYYFYPYCGGWCANLPYELGVPYGMLPGSLQLLAVFDPTAGGGTYTYVRDSSGSVKVMLLRKTDGVAVPPAYTPLFDPALGREPAYTPLPFASVAGTSLGVRTLWAELAPGASMRLCEAVVAAYAGDFRQPLKAYRWWVDTWWRHPQTPQWPRAYASYCYAHDEDCIREGRYVARRDIHPPHQVMQWAYWWQHSDLDRNGENPRPDRWYRETHGEYDYEQRWGGAEALRAEVRRYQQAGSRLVFYVQGYLAWKHSQVAREHHAQWGAMWPDGSWNEDYTDEQANTNNWGMCPRAPGWQDYLVTVCERLVRDTGADGVYLDSLNNAQFCTNPAHTHEREPAPGLTRLLIRAREVIVRNNPEGILWVEFPGSDYWMQFVDCTWLQTFSSSYEVYPKFDGFYGLHFLRFCFPELAYAEWNPDVWRPELLKRNLFNGVGSSAVSPYDHIMGQHASAFATPHPEPLIPTEVHGVLANRFPAKHECVYTLWNRSMTTASGVLLKVPHLRGAQYRELVSGTPVVVEVLRGEGMVQDALSMELPPGEVACVVQQGPASD